MTVYNELFHARKMIFFLKKQINDLNEQAKKRYSRELTKQMDEACEELAHQSVRMHILEKVCSKMVF